MRTFYACLIALAVFFNIGPADAVDNVAASTQLAGDFRSQMSLDEWKAHAKRAGFTWQVAENQMVEAKEERPRFSNIRIVVQVFTDLGESGEAHFQFFNERLMAIRYFPNDFIGYKSNLWRSKGAQADKAEILIEPSTRVYIAQDFRGLRFICFEDMALVRNMNNWIARYS